MARSLATILCWLVSVIALSLPQQTLRADDAEAPHLVAPEGFEVTHFADDALAPDIFCMTTDAKGRVVVSGPGYVRILIDDDHDGRADRFQQFADGPATGAQGMYFLDRTLLCIGDEGLIAYRDRDGDDRADGPPDLFLKLRTGSEHNSHAIQRGPDGWWYVIVGNDSEVSKQYATLPSTPIENPRAGVLLRLKPDLSGAELVAHGLRNAYDFAFHPSGAIFTYDSDDERDVSLPWYRPTRVFQMSPGTDAGWVSKSWKWPDDYLDLSPVIAEFGRGSPTGVCCYRHDQFPQQYRDALFVADWTFGRVHALPLKADGNGWKTEPIQFLKADGAFGFAPTDMEVGSDGSLYVSVGGRGTRGSVFRVAYAQAKETATAKTSDTEAADASIKKVSGNSPAIERAPEVDKLTACLRAPQPLSSWSRAKWLPQAVSLGQEAILAAAVDNARPVPERVRAIEVLTEVFGPLDDEALAQLIVAEAPEVRARAVWTMGRTRLGQIDLLDLENWLEDADPRVRLAAIEAAYSISQDELDRVSLSLLADRLADEDRAVREAAARLVSRLPDKHRADLAARITDPRGKLFLTFSEVRLLKKIDPRALETTLAAFRASTSRQDRLDALRMMQLAIGDVGPGGDFKAVFDGYHSPYDLSKAERQLDPLRAQASELYPTGDSDVDRELSRLLAMLAPYNFSLLDALVAKLTDESDPVDDIHHLIVIARIPVEHSRRQREAIAKALVNIEPKLVARKLHQDTNWDDRFGELYKALVEQDSELPIAIVDQPNLGQPGHVLFLSELPGNHLEKAITAFTKAIAADADYPWSNDVVFLLGESKAPEHRQKVRELYDRFGVRSAVLMVLAANPEEQDRDKFIEGLESSDVEVLSHCVAALSKLPESKSPEQLFALLRTFRRLGATEREYTVREDVVRLLMRSTGQEFPFVFGKRGHNPQADVIAQWTKWLTEQHADVAAKLLETDESALKTMQADLAAAPWANGDVERGHKLFETRSCAQCHGGRRALGPDLAGAGQRFSRDDLFTAIMFPNRDVSPRYQTSLIETKEGKVYTGLVVYESTDGLLLRDSTNRTYRIEAPDIADRNKLSTSLMPSGLLKDLKPADLADLYAYIQSLRGEPEKNDTSTADSTD